jgi:hypothetical protein
MPSSIGSNSNNTSDGDGEWSESSSEFSSDDGSETSKKRYKWRKRLRKIGRSSTTRYHHRYAKLMVGHERDASSLPDLGLYQTWDLQKAKKVINYSKTCPCMMYFNIEAFYSVTLTDMLNRN